MIKVKTITIVRAEGPTQLCGIKQVANSWEYANQILRQNSIYAPERGGYDKHDFTVVFEDGSEYKGRYDLMHWRVEWADLAKHCRSNLLWMVNDKRAVGLYGQAAIDNAKGMLKSLDFQLSAAELEDLKTESVYAVTLN